MDEKETTKGEEQDDSTKDNDEGNKPEEDNIVNRAHEENERMEKNIKERKELLEDEKEFYAKRKLGGGSEAGAAPTPKKRLNDLEYGEAYVKNEVNPFE